MDDFSDDDLDALNANALQELENNAIQFTQAQKKYDEPSQNFLDYDFEDDDLDDAVVQDELRGNPILPSAKPEQPAEPAIPATTSASTSAARTTNLATTTTTATANATARIVPQQQRSWVPSRYQASQQQPRPTGPTSHELAALQAQILDLQARLNTKDGEIQIVRSRLDKSRQDHDRELQALKKQTAEQIAKHERAIEAAKVAERTASTELEFTKRDLGDELNRAKRKDAPTTPRKNAAAKSWGIADGFEDVEMAGSPTKGQRGRNTGAIASAIVEPPARATRTPTKGKRKRLAIDSPINTLETHSEELMVVDHSGSNDNIVEPQTTLVAHGPTFDYLKVVLNHSAAHGRTLVFDYLAGFALSSRPTESLASILFQKLAAIGNPNDPMRLPIEFCEQVIQLWEACRKESCLEPITELVSLIAITLQLYTTAVAPYIAPSLIPIAMESCYDVGIPRFNNTNPNDPTDETWIKFNRNIPTTRILSLLYLTALGCAASPPVAGGVTPPISDFWSEIHVQFILMMLSPKHPIQDFLVTLRLLCTSVFPQSIGPTPPGQTAEFTAAHVIERVSVQLVELPRFWDLDKDDLCNVRNEILKTLAAFSRSEFGLAQMAAGDCIVPRLVSLIYASIDELYNEDMQSADLSYDPVTLTPASYTTNEGLSALIAHAMLLLHTIIRSPATRDTVDVSTKLNRLMGGPQKYLLSLARLNFAETETDDGNIAVISEETAELAHELLELAVTEEEGAELGVYFGGLS
ncbi:hypothetical protein SLS62_010275 [Diatrype stigma]|uniref:DNA repair protein Rad26 n=1 Tax=Diatrype stigma TaxID=117547 RepID=A0AAN9YIP9_9PEZI